MSLAPLLLLLACHSDDAVLEVISPSDGAVVRSPWMPVMLRIPQSYVGGDVSLTLDGGDVTDPLGLIRERTSHLEGHADYLAHLDVVDISAGPHTLEFTVTGPNGGGSRSLNAQFELSPHECRVQLTTVDEVARPVAARVVIANSGGLVDVAAPDAGAADPFRGRDSVLHSVFTVHGEAALTLPCESTSFYGVRGPLHAVDVQTVVLEPPLTDVLLTVGRAFELPNQIAADLHVHTGQSSDAFIPDRMRWRSLVAAGLDLVVITDHDLITDPSKAAAEVGALQEGLMALPGIEAQLHPARADENRLTPGHINAMPLRPDAPHVMG